MDVKEGGGLRPGVEQLTCRAALQLWRGSSSHIWTVPVLIYDLDLGDGSDRSIPFPCDGEREAQLQPELATQARNTRLYPDCLPLPTAFNIGKLCGWQYRSAHNLLIISCHWWSTAQITWTEFKSLRPARLHAVSQAYHRAVCSRARGYEQQAVSVKRVCVAVRLLPIGIGSTMIIG